MADPTTTRVGGRHHPATRLRDDGGRRPQKDKDQTMKNIGIALALVGAVAYETSGVGHRWRFDQKTAEAFDCNDFASSPGFVPWATMFREQRNLPDEERYHLPDGRRWHDVRDALQSECMAAAADAFRAAFGERALTREEWVAALNPPEWDWRQGDVPPMECVGIFVDYVRQGGAVHAGDIRDLSDRDVVDNFRARCREGRVNRQPWVTRALAESILARDSFAGPEIKFWARGAQDEARAYLDSGPAAVRAIWAAR